MNSETLISFFLAAMFLFFLSGCDTKQEDAPQDISASGEQIEEPAVRSIIQKSVPDYSFTTMEGESLNISDYEGQVVLLNFWATWCAPCIREIPELVSLKEKYEEEGFEIIGISLDEEGFTVVKSFFEQYNFKINYPIVHDDFTYAEMTGGIFAYPTTYIIDRNGAVVSRRIGEVTLEELEPEIIKIL
ncbi:MAG: TlpA family protein disulfide reductase [Cyclonatronaceae bacterium]